MRMRIARAHHLAAILKDLYMIDKWLFAKIPILVCPFVNDAFYFLNLHPRKRQAVIRVKNKRHDRCRARLCDQQGLGIQLAFGNIGLQGRKVVIKKINARICRIDLVACSFICRAEITFGVVRWESLSARLLGLALPWSLGAVR